MRRAELLELSKEQLSHKLADLTDEMFKLRMRRGTEELTNPLRLRMLRRDIARVNTLLREEALGKRKLATEEKKSDKK
jgi:large subunit ribosomal protein L29